MEKDLSSLITQARQFGLGRPVSFQKTEYTDSDLNKLKILISWWQLLNKISIPEWRDTLTTRKIQRIICSSLVDNRPLTFYAIFCPSYKKGIGVSGYTGKIGNHTKSYIRKYSNFVTETQKIGFMTNAVAYFSDLLLENFEKLIGTDYKKDLRNNFLSFKKEFSVASKRKIETRLLSEIDAFKSTIGEQGTLDGKINIPKKFFNIVMERNKVFYLNELGWSVQTVKERTEILARCYSKMGEVFREIYPNGVMFWVESAYERGSMYSGVQQDNPIPIIYPTKNE